MCKAHAASSLPIMCGSCSSGTGAPAPSAARCQPGTTPDQRQGRARIKGARALVVPQLHEQRVDARAVRELVEVVAVNVEADHVVRRRVRAHQRRPQLLHRGARAQHGGHQRALARSHQARAERACARARAPRRRVSLPCPRTSAEAADLEAAGRACAGHRQTQSRGQQ